MPALVKMTIEPIAKEMIHVYQIVEKTWKSGHDGHGQNGQNVVWIRSFAHYNNKYKYLFYSVGFDIVESAF